MGVEPTTHGYQTVALPTELTCWRPRPRPRAVHASAIRSAGAPGGTQEPAPLTRLPSRPLYGPIPAGILGRMEHEAGVEPACFGFKAQRGCRQPTARVLDQAAGIGPAWAAFRAQLGCQQPTPEKSGGPSRNRTLLTGFGDQCPPRGRPELAEGGRSRSTHP